MNKNQTLLETNATIAAMIDSNRSYLLAPSHMKEFSVDGIIRCLLYDDSLWPIYTCLFVTHIDGGFLVGIYMRVCKKMVIYLGIKTPQSRKERRYTRQKKTHVYGVAEMIASILGKKPHVHRVIILKQMADHIKLACSSLVLKVNDDIWEYMTRDIEKCPLFVLTGVCIKRVNLMENVWAFRWDKQYCLFYMGTSIKWVSVECGSTLVVRFDSVYWVLRLDVHVLL